tara:strand:+ start:66 stop:638 length:573 start_codon:yes stop_codon:yes gene_type:complete
MSTLTLGGSTLASKSGSTLSLDSGVTFPGPGTGADGGHVLQVAYNSSVTQAHFSISNGNEETLLSHTITPSLSSSKVLIEANLYFGNGNNFGLVIKRGSTVIGGNGLGTSNYRDTEFHVGADNFTIEGDSYTVTSYSLRFLDAPSTTSATTYSIHAKAVITTAIVYYNRALYAADYGTGRSNITLTEIAG